MKLKIKVKVEQFHTKNQYVIYTSEGTFFQSYATVIAHLHKGKITLDRESWGCSKITGRYRNLFLGETKKETEAKIKSGEYQLADLN